MSEEWEYKMEEYEKDLEQIKAEFSGELEFIKAFIEKIEIAKLRIQQKLENMQYYLEEIKEHIEEGSIKNIVINNESIYYEYQIADKVIGNFLNCMLGDVNLLQTLPSIDVPYEQIEKTIDCWRIE